MRASSNDGGPGIGVLGVRFPLLNSQIDTMELVHDFDVMTNIYQDCSLVYPPEFDGLSKFSHYLMGDIRARLLSQSTDGGLGAKCTQLLQEGVARYHAADL